MLTAVKAPVALGIIHQMVRPIVARGEIVVVVQEWPCWLVLAALALGLPVATVFVQAQFHALFAHLVGDTVVWRTLKEWSDCPPGQVCGISVQYSVLEQRQTSLAWCYIN
jgi:hypothetical protein